MKLWMKTLSGLGVIGTVAGATIGGMYAYSKFSPSVQGYAHSASLPLENDLSSMSSLADEKAAFEKLDLHFIGQGDNPTTSIAKFDANFDDSTKDTVEYKGKTMQYDAFLEAYIDETGNQPTLVTYAGTALFQNQYLSAVNASDFAHYVAWFMTNVSWGPDMSSLDSFTIVRGIEKVGSAIMLGGHASIKKEATNIKFYPDAFFGSLPMYNGDIGAGNGPDNLLFKANIAPLTWSGVQRLIKANKESNAAFTGQSKLRYIEDIGLLPGTKEHGYVVYADAYTGLVDALLNDKVINKLSVKHNLAGPYIDENGDAKIGIHDGIDLSTRVSYLDVLKVSESGYHGIGYNFLKYVGAHEYGHHQTLQTASDISESGVVSGGYSTRTGITATAMYNKDIMNLYFSARDAELRLTGEDAKTEATDSPRDQVPKFWENHKVEEGNPFGTDATKGDGRAAMTWPELEALAKKRGVSLWTLILENSFDIKSGTLNPATGLRSTWFYDMIDQKFVQSVKGVEGGGIIQTYSAPKADGTVDKIPLEFTLDPTTNVLMPKVATNTGEWAVHKEDGSPMFDGGKPGDTWAAAHTTYGAVAQKVIATYAMKLPYNYQLNGWNTSKDGDSQADLDRKDGLLKSQIFEDYASIFTDYTNNFPEVLTRDNLQTVYMPSDEKLDYVPEYLSMSEATTGLEYYIPGTLSSKWLEDARSASAQYPITTIELFKDYSKDLEDLMKDIPSIPTGSDQSSQEWLDYLKAVQKDMMNPEVIKIMSEIKSTVDNFAGSLQAAVFQMICANIVADQKSTSVMAPVISMILATTYAGTYPTLADPTVAMDTMSSWLELMKDDNWINGLPRTIGGKATTVNGLADLFSKVSYTSWAATVNYLQKPHYLGKTQMSQNGWLKDRTMKLTMGSSLYRVDGLPRKINFDDHGHVINPSDPGYWDPKDIIQKLDGSGPAETYAEAQWLYTLRSKGVGARTITGLWRSKERDAVYMWGYIPTVDKNGEATIMPKYLQFTDKATGENIYLPVATDVDNLHYYKTQKVGAESVTLDHAHEGAAVDPAKHVPYTSWMSDFASMGAYRNALLKGDHDYTIEFVDADKKVIPHLFTMGPTGETGSRTVIAENGKTPSQAPTVLTTDASGTVTVTVKKQFNI